MTTQRKHIIDTVNALTDSEELLFGAGLNVEMSGDMLEVSETFDVGDVYTFDLSLLQSSKNEIVQKVADLLVQMADLKESLINLHSLTDEEIDEVRQENEDFGNPENEDFNSRENGELGNQENGEL